MNLADIHWHDCVLNRVIELPARNELLLEVEYPLDWRSGTYAPRTLVFRDALRYSVHEGPFHGCPTLLSASSEGERDGRMKVRIETNAGYRVLEARQVAVEDRGSAF